MYLYDWVKLAVHNYVFARFVRRRNNLFPDGVFANIDSVILYCSLDLRVLPGLLPSGAGAGLLSRIQTCVYIM